MLQKQLAKHTRYVLLRKYTEALYHKFRVQRTRDAPAVDCCLSLNSKTQAGVCDLHPMTHGDSPKGDCFVVYTDITEMNVTHRLSNIQSLHELVVSDFIRKSTRARSFRLVYLNNDSDMNCVANLISSGTMYVKP